MILLAAGLAFVAGSSLMESMQTSESDQLGSSDARVAGRFDRYLATAAGVAR
jgi:hypothetical protein